MFRTSSPKAPFALFVALQLCLRFDESTSQSSRWQFRLGEASRPIRTRAPRDTSPPHPFFDTQYMALCVYPHFPNPAINYPPLSASHQKPHCSLLFSPPPPLPVERLSTYLSMGALSSAGAVLLREGGTPPHAPQDAGGAGASRF